MTRAFSRTFSMLGSDAARLVHAHAHLLGYGGTHLLRYTLRRGVSSSLYNITQILRSINVFVLLLSNRVTAHDRDASQRTRVWAARTSLPERVVGRGLRRRGVERQRQRRRQPVRVRRRRARRRDGLARRRLHYTPAHTPHWVNVPFRGYTLLIHSQYYQQLTYQFLYDEPGTVPFALACFFFKNC